MPNLSKYHPIQLQGCMLFTFVGTLLHKHVSQGWLTSSEEVSEANGLYLHSAAAGVAHAADQLGNAPGVMLQDSI